VSAEEVDDYLRGVEEPKRSTLQASRRSVLEIVPDAEQSDLLPGAPFTFPSTVRCRRRSWRSWSWCVLGRCDRARA